MQIDAVLFDWGGTLSPWHTTDPLDCWRAYARALPGGVGDACDVADVEAVAARLLAAEDAAWRRAREHHESSTLDVVLAAAGVPVVSAAVEAYFADREPYTLVDPDAPAVLRALRERGLRVGVLSNTLWPRSYHERLFARDEVLHLLDGAVYTSEIARVKPHREAFEAAMVAVGVDDPTRVVFVGDRLYDDVHGAASVGMRTVFVPHSAIPPNQRGRVEGVPDAVVARLADLLSVLDEWSRERPAPATLAE